MRAICLALPAVTERLSHGAPGFFVGKQFVMLWPDGHHARPFPHLWCAAAPGAQQSFVETAPDRFFRPPYVGARGWVSLRLDGAVDWAEVEMLCEDACVVTTARSLRRGSSRACSAHKVEAASEDPASAGATAGSSLTGAIRRSFPARIPGARQVGHPSPSICGRIPRHGQPLAGARPSGLSLQPAAVGVGWRASVMASSRMWERFLVGAQPISWLIFVVSGRRRSMSSKPAL